MNIEPRVINVVCTTDDMYDARLAVVRMNHAGGVETLYDIYCFAIALSSHIAIIEKTDPLAELDEEKFLNMLVLAKFVDENGNELTGNYKVSVHFTPLAKHCIVRPDAHGTNIVFYHKENDTPDTEFELGVIVAQKTYLYEPTGEYEVLHRLQSSWQNDIPIAISLLGLEAFKMNVPSPKLRVPVSYKNGGFLMREPVQQQLVTHVKDIDAIKMTSYLAEQRRDLGNTAKRLCDVFGMHLMLADYELRIPNGAFGSELNKEQFLTFLVKTKFLAKNGTVVQPGKTIGIHHQALQMHCLVKVMENGSNQAFYHKSLRDDIERFLIACIRPEGEGYYEGFTLKEQAHDITALNLALGHVNFDAATGRTLVPEKHRNYESQMMDRAKFGYVP